MARILAVMMNGRSRRARARLGRDGHEVVKAADPTAVLGWTFALRPRALRRHDGARFASSSCGRSARTLDGPIVFLTARVAEEDAGRLRPGRRRLRP